MSIKLTYTDDYPRAKESNWSILNKTLRFNHISFIDFRELIIRTKKGRFKSFYLYSDSEVDFSKLRKYVAIDESNFSIEEFNLQYLPSFSSLNISIEKDYMSKLIFCPECIKFGFHSPLYMSPLLSHCPIHKCKLLDLCPNCRKKIPYILSVDALINPYGCPSCGFDFFMNKNSFTQLNVKKIDIHIKNLIKISKIAEGLHWIFNFDRQVPENSNSLSSKIIDLSTNIKPNDSNDAFFNWSFNDTDLAEDIYWPATQLNWEEMPRMLQIGLKDSLFNSLIDAFCLYMNSNEFNKLSLEIDDGKKNIVIDLWQKVWSQRVSRFKEFGRFRLLDVFISNKIIDCDLHQVNGMCLMRSFEIFLVNVLCFQLHLTYITAIRSKNEGFDLRNEIEALIENTQFISNRKVQYYDFYALIPKDTSFEKRDISLVRLMVKKLIAKSNIYIACRKTNSHSPT